MRRSVPQTAVLAQTYVFVTRLFHGLTLVCVWPYFGDQPQSADRVVAQGAGVLVPPAEISAARVAAEVERGNGESIRANAVPLAASLRACGGLERALHVIESATTAHARTE